MANRDKAWMLLIVVGIGAGISIGYSLGHRFPFKFEKDFVEVLSAIGTLGAVFVALYFGLSATRQQRLEAKARSELAAAFVHVDVTGLKIQTELLLDALEVYDGTEQLPPVLLEHFSFTNPLMDAKPEDMRIFFDVSPGVAVRMGSALAELRSIKYQLALTPNRLQEAFGTPGSRIALVRWHIDCARRATIALTEASDLVYGAMYRPKIARPVRKVA